MDIPVKFYTTARELFGKKQDMVILEQGGSVEDLLDLLFETRVNGISRKNMDGKLIVFVNEVRATDMRDVLKEGDRISLFGAI
ncbi:MAG: MoaD/ThiS family protein [Spirochaetia bacterium]